MHKGMKRGRAIEEGISVRCAHGPTIHCNKRATPWEVAWPGDVVGRLYGTPNSLPTSKHKIGPGESEEVGRARN